MAPPPQVSESLFEPCASTASLFVYAQGPVIVCLHHDTLAIERRFQLHQDDINFISVDNVSDRGAGRLIVSYDVGRTAIIWDLFTGMEIARYSSLENLLVASWMRNGNLAFGNDKGDIILFEPSTSEHISTRTILDPITALSPSSDCRTYAIGYQNGSILLAVFHPTFTILHSLGAFRDPSPIVGLAWHASSTRQKSDMLASQTYYGDLRVWSVSKPPGKESPRTIRVLRRPDSAVLPGPKWIAWSKNGRVIQYLGGEAWAWDVRTKHVAYERIPIIDNVRGIANYGPTATLFTLGPEHTVQQYDVETPEMVANMQHLPFGLLPPQTREDARYRNKAARNLHPSPDINDSGGLSAIRGIPFETHELDALRERSDSSASAKSQTDSANSNSRASSSKHRRMPFSPPSKSAQRSGTTFLFTPAAREETSQESGTSLDDASSMSPMKNPLQLSNEIQSSQPDRTFAELFPFARARLNDVPYRQHPPLDETYLTPDDLRRQMLSVVFGWDHDVRDLIKDEQNRYPVGSQNAILLSQWLGESDTDEMESLIGVGPVSSTDWMVLAFSQMTGQRRTNKANVGQGLVQKLLEMGDVHTAATILVGLGDLNDAIEVYVSRNHIMEAILLTCLLMPSDWQRQSYLVHRWGEEVVSHSRQLAIRCFMCTSVEPSVPWSSAGAKQAAPFSEMVPRSPMTSPDYFKFTAGNGLPPRVPSLKVVTSFNSDNDPNFKLPVPISDDETPTNMPRIMRESAMGESAPSPANLRSNGTNGVQGMNLGTGARMTTPAFARARLPSIGETPIDVNPPAFPVSNSSQKHGNLTLVTDTNGSMPEENPDRHSGEEGPLDLLPSATYDPGEEAAVRRSPQTAFQTTAGKFASIKGPPPPGTGLYAALTDQSHNQNGSRSRKPDGLEIQLPSSGHAQPTLQGQSTTTTPAEDQSDAVASSRSPAASLNSSKSTNTPIVSGRSIDRYISTLEEANYHSRVYNNTHDRLNADDSASQDLRKPYSQITSQDRRGRSDHRLVQQAKPSSFSPVPMSTEDLVQHEADNEKCHGTARSKTLTSRTRSESNLGNGNTKAKTYSGRHQHRSSSRNVTSHGGKGRHPGRGRSGCRDGSSVRESSSPRQMSPEDGSFGRGEGLDNALRLVAVDRERLQSQRGSSRRHRRRAESDSNSRRGRSSSSSKRIKPRSSSGRIREPVLTAQETNNPVSKGAEEEAGSNEGIKESPGISSEEPRNIAPASNVQFRTVSWEKKKQLAAAELEARRLSLARNPSAPKIPYPGQPLPARGPKDSPLSFNSISPRLANSANNGTPQSKSSPDYYSSSPNSGSSLSSAPFGLPANPRVMRRPSDSNESARESGPAVSPSHYDPPTFLTNARYSNGSDRIPRSMSVPVPEQPRPYPTGIPTHPRYNPNIPRSRSTSRTPDGGHRRDSSRETGAIGTSPSVTVSIEETLQGTGTAFAPNPDPSRNHPLESQFPPPSTPPIIPELQHLNAPPPPPPPPASTGLNGSNLHDSMGTIDIAIESTQESAGQLLPRSMTAAPASSSTSPSTSTSLSPPRRRRMSLDYHRRSRSFNESFSNKIRSFTMRRMRSDSRGGAGTGAQSPFGENESSSPYESVRTVENGT